MFSFFKCVREICEMLELYLDISCFFFLLLFHYDYREWRIQDSNGLKKLICMVSFSIVAIWEMLFFFLIQIFYMLLLEFVVKGMCMLFAKSLELILVLTLVIIV